ncbi:hypothetical protein ACFQGE_10005 [Halomicroarcula sp. GCM10025817]|uniref:hypothetical protein n=1 Tax=Haloarcula TaxID=2237 RepID=UPI0023E8257C|nr:hypothetical protein [Halomicroarcula sp. SYNS111]
MTTDSERVNRTDPSTVSDQADRVLVSFRSPETDPDENEGWFVADSAWLEENMTEPTYLRYLRWAHAGPVAVGDEWDEFVNCGCASPEDVILRVERVEGGTGIGADTTIDVVSRKRVLEADDASAVRAP